MPQQHIWLLPQNWGYLVSFGTYFFKNFTKIFQKWLFWSVWESSICKVKKEETIHFTHFNMAIDYVRGVFSRHTPEANRVNPSGNMPFFIDCLKTACQLTDWLFTTCLFTPLLLNRHAFLPTCLFTPLPQSSSANSTSCGREKDGFTVSL